MSESEQQEYLWVMPSEPPNLSQQWQRHFSTDIHMPSTVEGALELFASRDWRVRLEAGQQYLAELVDAAGNSSICTQYGMTPLHALLLTYINAHLFESEAGMNLTPQLAFIPKPQDRYNPPDRFVDLAEGKEVIESICKHFGFSITQWDESYSQTIVSARWRDKYELIIIHEHTDARNKPVWRGSLSRKFANGFRILHDLPIDEFNPFAGKMEHNNYRHYPSLFKNDIDRAITFLGMIDTQGYAYGTIRDVIDSKDSELRGCIIETRQSKYGVKFKIPIGESLPIFGTQVRYSCYDALQETIKRQTPYEAKTIASLHDWVLAGVFFPKNKYDEFIPREYN